MASSPREECQIAEVEAGAAMLALWANLITGVLAALVSPLAGKMSDTLGRIRVMAACGVGILLADLIMALIASMPDVFSMRWLYLSFILEGFR